MSYVRESFSEPVTLSPQEATLARHSCAALAERLNKNEPVTMRLDVSGQTVTLPAGAARILVDALAQMAEGKGVSVVSTDSELTTQQAADLLGVSRPYFVAILEREEIPYHTVGTHRRVLMHDVLGYMGKDIAKRKKMASDLTRFSQDIGLDY